MGKVNKRSKKKINSNWQKIALMVISIVLVIMIILVGYKICTKFLFNSADDVIKMPEKQVIDLDNYDYYLHGNATNYEKSLAKELKKVLSSEEVNDSEYAKVLTKMFVSDLFTLKNKNSSSDITSSQYVYESYQETFKTQVKDTIYAGIEIDLDGTRTQTLPVVTNVEVVDVKNDKFIYNDEVLDSNAYYVSVNIEYKEDLDYPSSYKVVLVKNKDLLQVVKAFE